MRLYDFNASANCYKVRLLAAQLGLELELVPVDLFAGESQTPEHLARNPAGRTPVLELDSGDHLAESGAILLYLAEGTALLPDDKLGRARAAQWLFFEQNLLEPNIGTGRFWILTGRAEGRDELVRRWQKVGRHSLDVLERRLAGHEFLLDTSYSVADVGLYAYTHLAGDAGIELGDYPGVEAWLRRVEAQPGFMNDLEPYPEHAGSGGRSAHG
ncbi:MAG: glutathione S-transferase family protein [Actinobacteria bacterium]|nr:glutathione S-transferase family protein [Actinomycetota bacterium]